ncbi:carboxy-terminal kinesin 2 isoform X2 [Anas platyrhynchos]|uniref:carboxy-terminal kinesin 2 isoform X2 n=1 Tax=Anas platyrhynchos TaxID=8839 RepID=UPI003AF207D4
MAARPGGGGGARPVPATAAAASLPAASRLPVRKAHAKRAAAAPEPEAPEQKRRRSGPRAGWAPSSRAPLRAISVPTAPGPGLLRKAMTVAAAPQAGKKAPGAASGSAAPPPVPGVRWRAAGDPRGQLAELREKIRGLEDDNRQLREQLQHSRAREEELEGQVSSLRTELQQSQEERSRWQREAEAQAAERQRLAAELQERHRQLEELREAARDREEQLGAAQGNIRVFCRVRPLLAAEQEAQKGLEHLHFPPEDNKTLVLCRTEGSHTGRRGEVRYDFSFDRVFPPGASQEDVFEEIALLVQSALDGYPVCIFAYGQTGSGKTYTMEGPGGADPTSWGVIPRAVRHLFGGARQLEHKGWQYSFSASFLEIYNEALRDLLGGDRGGELEIRHVSSASKELHVPNLRCVPVASEDEVLGLLQTAASKRSVARTALNDRSSRSHCVFQLHIQGSNASRALRCSSVLSLVDLAGSERLDKCQASGQRLRETQAINSSLATLGLVIMAISNKEPHVPYRNSKLTYLLQNSLRGNAKMLMFVNISPLEENFAESLNSLRFASKVNECMVGTAHANKK